MKTLVLAIALATSGLTLAQNDAHVQSADEAFTVAEGAVPDGLATDDWGSILAAYDAGRHAAYAGDGGYKARNPGQDWTTTFDGRGFSVEPVVGGWTWGLELVSYGFADAHQAVTTADSISAASGRVAYKWSDDLEEWYVNDSRGLEHGYTVHRRPLWEDADGEIPLTFTLAVRGMLQPEVTAGGRGVRFVDPGGTPMLNYSGLTVFDADGQDLDARFEHVDGLLVLLINERRARYPLTIDPIAQQAYLKASNTNPGDHFGCSVSVSGDTVVVGAYREQSNATGVGGDQTDNSMVNAGAAYVFVRNGASWIQEAYLKASNTDESDAFGWSVAISGDTVVVGAFNEASDANTVNGDESDNSACGAGAAYVFTRTGSTWSQQAYLKASNSFGSPWTSGLGSDEFGRSVAIAGDIVIVGAPNEESNATGVNGDQSNNASNSSGAAYVFVRSGINWTQEAYLKATSGPSPSWKKFGSSVAASGNSVAVGAPSEGFSEGGYNYYFAGAVYVFTRSGASWSPEAQLIASNRAEGDRFGDSIALSQDTLVIGASGEDSNAIGVNGNQDDDSSLDAGAAYVFIRNGVNWSQQAYLKALNTEPINSDPYYSEYDRFGSSVAIAGDVVVVGAPGEASLAYGVDCPQNNSALNSGAAYLFSRSGTTWSLDSFLKASNTDGGDSLGSAVAVSGSLVVAGASREDADSTGPGGNQGNNSAVDSGAVYLYELGLVSTDCNCNGISDLIDIASGFSQDCTLNNVPDECDIASGLEDDCNQNGVPDACDLVLGTTSDCNNNQIPDECDLDCNANGVPDDCELANGTAPDCNLNGVPDECDIAQGASPDCDFDGFPDECTLTFAVVYCNCDAGAPCGNMDAAAGCANSSGQGSRLSVCGSASVASDDLLLNASNLPPFQFGLYYTGPAQTQSPFGDGQRCIFSGGAVGAISRFPIRNSGAAGTITEGPGIVAYSQANFSPANHIQPGQTWNFQHWHRDVLGPCGSSFNLTNAVAVTFAP